jgi:hypothetical protein
VFRKGFPALPSLSITQSNIQAALVSFLTGVLPSGMEIDEGQINRVPEPSGSDFVVFWVLRRERLATNIDAYADCAFTASIAGSVLNVAQVQLGTITPGATLFGSGVAANTVISQGLSGTGGVGTYSLSIPQTISSEQMAAGTLSVMQETMIVFQLDVHGPNSSDNAQIITTLFRDAFAVDFFNQFGNISPLYADDPKQIPFINAESQYEYRWVIEAHLQADQVVLGLPQQFASTVTLTTESVTVTFPQ